MIGGPDRPLLGEDPAFLTAWKAAIAREPVEEQGVKSEIIELCIEIERTVRDCARDVADCNVIVARTSGRLIAASAEQESFA